MWESSFEKRDDTPQTQEQQRQAAIEKIIKETWAEIRNLKGQIKIADAKINKMIFDWEKNTQYREQQFKKPWNDRNDRKNLEAWIKKMEESIWAAKRVAAAIKLINNNPNDPNAKKINDFVDKYSLELQDAKKLLTSRPAREASSTSWIRVDEVPSTQDNNDSNENADDWISKIPLKTIYDKGYDAIHQKTFGQILREARYNVNANKVYNAFLEYWQDVAIRAVLISYFETQFWKDANRVGSQYHWLLQVWINTHAGLIRRLGLNNMNDVDQALVVAKKLYEWRWWNFRDWIGPNQRKVWYSWAA